LVSAPSGEIVVYGLRGTAYWSGDQGASWEKIDTGVQVALTAGTVLADGSLALLSQGGDVLLSRDKGRNFRKQGNTEPMAASAIAQSRDGALVVGGLRGVKRMAASAVAQR
jgi:photosystem II stability/assembly factor-like uncharacterized protein